MCSSGVVFDVRDLLQKIVWCVVGAQNPRELIGGLCVLKQVSQAWLSTSQYLLDVWFKLSTRAFVSLESRILKYLAMSASPARNRAFVQILQRKFWTAQCIDQTGSIFSIVPNENTNDRLKDVLVTRKPKCVREMFNQISRLCYCCGRRCTTLCAESDRSASLLHPYCGDIRPQLLQNKMPVLDRFGHAVNQLTATIIPHTNAANFVSICFKKEDEFFYSVLCTTDPVMTLAEKKYRNFVYAARSEPWYEAKIARLFALRPTELPFSSFMVNLPLENLIVKIAPDASVAEIFGLSRTELRRLITVGGRLRKEGRLLWTAE